MNIRLSLFGYEILDLSFDNDQPAGYVVLGGDYELDPEVVSYGFSMEKDD